MRNEKRLPRSLPLLPKWFQEIFPRVHGRRLFHVGGEEHFKKLASTEKKQLRAEEKGNRPYKAKQSCGPTKAFGSESPCSYWLHLVLWNNSEWRIKKTRRTVKFKTSKTKETSNCLTDWQNQKDLLKMSSILRSRTSEFTAAVLRLFVQLCIQPHNLAGLTLIFQHAIDYYDSKPIVDFDRTTSVLERTSLVFNTKDFHSTKRDSIRLFLVF